MGVHTGPRLWGDQVSGEPNTAVWRVRAMILGRLPGGVRAPLEKVCTLCVCLLYQDLHRHQVVLGTAFFMLTLFVALYVLVYVECLVQRWLRALALLIWACLMVLGSVLMWNSLENEAYAWEQVMVGADVPGLGYQQLKHAVGTVCPLVTVGSWKWANAACSRGSPCRLWCWISDGLELSLFSEECPLGYVAFWIEPV